MAKVHDFLEMWQGSQNLHATQKESRSQNKQMATVGYISDSEEIIKASWSLFQHDGTAAFKLSERSPLQPALSAKNLPGGLTQILSVHRIRRIDHHPVESDEGSAPECISDTENWLYWNGNLDIPNHRDDDWEADIEFDIVPDNCSEDPESREQQDVCDTTNVAALILPTQRSRRHAEKVLMVVIAIETRRNKGFKIMLDTMR